MVEEMQLNMVNITYSNDVNFADVNFAVPNVILDTGCSKSVAGANVISKIPKRFIKWDTESNETFRFGDGKISKANRKVLINTKGLSFVVHVIEDSNLPVLLSLEEMKRLNTKITVNNDELAVIMRNQKIPASIVNGHIVANIFHTKNEVENLNMNFNAVEIRKRIKGFCRKYQRKVVSIGNDENDDLPIESFKTNFQKLENFDKIKVFHKWRKDIEINDKVDGDKIILLINASEQKMLKLSTVTNENSLNKSSKIKIKDVDPNGEYDIIAVAYNTCNQDVFLAERENKQTTGKKIKLTNEELIKLHKQFGHPSNTRLLTFLKKCNVCEDTLKKCRNLHCTYCKNRRPPESHPLVSLGEDDNFNDCLCIDGFEIKGEKFLMLLDSGTGYVVIEPYTKETAKGTIELISTKWVKYFGTPKAIRADAIGQNISIEFAKYCRQRSIDLQLIPERGHWQLRVETYIRSIKNVLKSLKRDHPDASPEELACYVTEAHNSCPSTKSSSSPHERVFLSRLRIPNIALGDEICSAIAENANAEFSNIDARTLARTQYAKVICSRKLALALSKRVRNREFENLEIGQECLFYEDGGLSKTKRGWYKGTILKIDENKIQLLKANKQIIWRPRNMVKPFEKDEKLEKQKVEERIERNTAIDEANQHYVLQTQDKRSIQHKECTKRHWLFFNDAKRKEIKSWITHNTMSKTDVNEIPEDAVVIPLKWVLTFKPLPKDETAPDIEKIIESTPELQEMDKEKLDKLVEELPTGIKFKARAVALGFVEDPAFVSSPTVSLAGIRMALSMIRSNEWKLKSLDIPTAFLQGQDLDRELYLKLLPEYKEFGYGDYAKCVGSVYGLCDAPLRFFLAVKEYVIKELKMEQSTSEKAMFFSEHAIIICHVDDLIFGGSQYFNDVLLPKLVKRFNIKFIDESDSFKHCGAIISTDRCGNVLMDQKDYIATITEIPVQYGTTKNEMNDQDIHDAQQRLGELNWVGIKTRPDLCFTISDGISKVHSSTRELLTYINRTIRNAKAHMDIKCKFVKLDWSNLAILSYGDAGIASRHIGQIHFIVDKTELENAIKSQEEVELRCNVLYWNTSKCKRVPVSSFHSELQATQSTIDKGIWLYNILKEIAPSVQKPIICSDGKNVVQCVHSEHPKMSEARLIRDISQVREYLIENDISNIIYVAGRYMVADPLTKDSAENMNILREAITNNKLRIKM